VGRRRERTPSPVEDEEREEEQGTEEEEAEQREAEQGSEDDDEHVQGEEEEFEEGALGGQREVWLHGPSQLPQRPIPPTRRPMIRPAEPK